MMMVILTMTIMTLMFNPADLIISDTELTKYKNTRGGYK